MEYGCIVQAAEAVINLSNIAVVIRSRVGLGLSMSFQFQRKNSTGVFKTI